MSADVLPFPGNPGAPIQPIAPRPEFGLRKPGDNFAYLTRDETAGFIAAREEDLRQQRQAKEIARLARAARAAMKGGDAILARAIAEVLDQLVEVARDRKSVRFQLLAQQIENLSEVCTLIEAEAQP